MLVKFKNGFSSPPYIHNVSYRGVVIHGLVHNDDPTAEKMWLMPRSFWTQPAGASHITAANAEIAYLWGKPDATYGSFLKLTANFKGTISNDNSLKALVVSGKATHQWNKEKLQTPLTPSSFFSSKVKGKHRIKTKTEVVLYINSNGRYTLR